MLRRSARKRKPTSRHDNIAASARRKVQITSTSAVPVSIGIQMTSPLGPSPIPVVTGGVAQLVTTSKASANVVCTPCQLGTTINLGLDTASAIYSGSSVTSVTSVPLVATSSYEITPLVQQSIPVVTGGVVQQPNAAIPSTDVFKTDRWVSLTDNTCTSSSLQYLKDQLPAFCLASRSTNTQRQYRNAFNLFYCLSMPSLSRRV